MIMSFCEQVLANGDDENRDQTKHPDAWTDGLAFNAYRSALKAVALLPFVLLLLVEDLTVRCHPAHFNPWWRILQLSMYLPEDKNTHYK